MHHLELSPRAQRDLRKFKNRKTFATLMDAIEEGLGSDPHPENLDIKLLKGCEPWRRLRSGNYRIVFRPLEAKELKMLAAKESSGYIIERVIDRSELPKATSRLPRPPWPQRPKRLN